MLFIVMCTIGSANGLFLVLKDTIPFIIIYFLNATPGGTKLTVLLHLHTASKHKFQCHIEDAFT